LPFFDRTFQAAALGAIPLSQVETTSGFAKIVALFAPDTFPPAAKWIVATATLKKSLRFVIFGYVISDAGFFETVFG
jgi:hypothetical protein